MCRIVLHSFGPVPMRALIVHEALVFRMHRVINPTYAISSRLLIWVLMQ